MGNVNVDVAVIGGGPAGATVGALLKKYAPELTVAIFEREVFPRDHVGESLLPPVSAILHEMGCWDKVEAANFPIKIGATYRWGKSPELWDFEFFPADEFQDQPRPAKYEGQRKLTAFQVDRAIYDEILLNHAESMGCQVFQGTRITKVHANGDTVTRIETEGRSITARFYVDASGVSGIVRRAMGVPCKYPSTLQNIAIWDYWDNADWAVHIGVGATRIQVRSLGYGWIWFIPLGPTRTSIGLVVPADYYKRAGKKLDELYREALAEEASIHSLLANATCRNSIETTRDWSFVAERQSGANWFLVGEAAGFADPILSAGVTMSQIGAQQLAYTILELFQSNANEDWLKGQFARRQLNRIETHIRFGDYWYTANAQFGELKEFTAELARSNGLDLSPAKAWEWLARGGFIDDDLTVGTGGFNLLSLRTSTDFLAELQVDSPLEERNVLTLDIEGATRDETALYSEGKVLRIWCYSRQGRRLPIHGVFGIIIRLLQQEKRLPNIVQMMEAMAKSRAGDPIAQSFLATLPEAIEGMIRDGWIRATFDPSLPRVGLVQRGTGFRFNTDTSN